MKTLYFNINGENIQSTDDLIVVGSPKDAIINKFYFELGNEIVRGVTATGISKVGKKSLVTDFADYEEAFEKILDQWEQVKLVLLGPNPIGIKKITLPEEYINWLKDNRNPVYAEIATSLYKRDCIVEINIGNFYRDHIGKLANSIDSKDYGSFVVNDTIVDNNSAILVKIREKIGENVPFVPYEEWLDDNLDKGVNSDDKADGKSDFTKQEPKINEETDKDETIDIDWDDLFPVFGVTLGKTDINDIAERMKLTTNEVCDKTRFGIIDYLWLEMSYCSLLQYQDSIHKIVIYSFPKNRVGLFGFSIGSSLKDIEREISKRGIKIQSKHEAGDHIWYLITPDEKYIIRLKIDWKDLCLNEITITLNQCPYCGSSDFESDEGHCDDGYVHIVCNNCGRPFYA